MLRRFSLIVEKEREKGHPLGFRVRTAEDEPIPKWALADPILGRLSQQPLPELEEVRALLDQVQQEEEEEKKDEEKLTEIG